MHQILLQKWQTACEAKWHHKQDGLVFLLLWLTYSMWEPCSAEKRCCPQNCLLSGSIRNFLSISIYEDTHSRGGRLKTMGPNETVLFYISYTWFSITMSNYYQRCFMKLSQLFIDAYTGSVDSKHFKIVLNSHKSHSI